ncbi:GNAT family N-acetyltransferase [Paenibacillus sp. GCM10027629]|uniref:GNAT family N-acetyltransferase n=1 Tax=Paenibacillus sp. GCM10027629 TaxID=3273414 RepID=UPI003643C8E2
MKEQTEFNELVVRKAYVSDFSTLIDLFTESSKWLRNLGLNQWSHFLDDHGRDDVLDSISNGTAYVFLKNNLLVGTVTIQLDPDDWDKHVWADLDVRDSIFIHRLAISHKEKGRGLGREILNWIEHGFDIPQSKRYLKLDCVNDNLKLNEYYIQSGFQFLGRTEDGHSKYQKELSD